VVVPKVVGKSKVTVETAVQKMAKMFRGGRAGGRDPLCQDAFFASRHGSCARARVLMQIRRYRIDDASKAYQERSDTQGDE
jgi:hypothetical protein